MKWRLIILLLLALPASVHAAHIAGGELQYKYLGPGSANSDRYLLTMRLFRECTSTGPRLENEIVNVGIYSTSTLTLKLNVVLPMIGGLQTIQLQENAIPCLVGSPNVCYQVAIYSMEIELPRTTDGYTLGWARCCRANGLINATGQIGATYVAYIPGTNALPNGNNSSPEFVVKDTALVCGDNDFVLDFGASDIDGDSLTYEFCEAFLGGNTGNQNAPPPSNLSLQSIPYAGYSGAQPMGPTVTISRTTGVISGVAPKTPGRYVVNVCVTEWREGIAISQHRKDFILKVGDCNIIAARLNEQYINCDSFTVHLQNETNSSQIKSYFWDFGVTGTTNDTSIIAQPVFTYPDTGVYQVKLIINRNEECSDTATSFIRIFPGFTPKFTFAGSCFLNPFQFTDASTAAYGVINNWKWDFGVTGALNDTSRVKNPSYQYNQMGPKEVTLTVGSSKGCVGIFRDTALVSDKPYLVLPFRDTLICSVDSLQLQATGNGIFSWTGSNIINSNTANPVVFPKQTTTYYVELNENTCVNTDSIRVNVIDAVSIKVSNDTAMCYSDSMKIQVTSNALSYTWSPVLDIDDPSAKEPMIAPSATRQYQVTGNVGKCFAKDSISIVVSPYPYVFAGNDTSICYGDKVQLHGNVLSTTFDWNNTNVMINGNTLSPTAGITKDTYFILTGHGYEQCPKSRSDSVLIKVIPQVKAFAGNDTTVTIDQPLTLQATGGLEYTWSPVIFLNNPGIANPTAVFINNDLDLVRYQVTVTTQEGCKGTDDINIVIFKTGPQIFVPGAFTPNNDTKNDLLYPVITGMKQLDFFRVYNRYGQLLFSTKEENKGWDGRFGGKEQPAGSYVYMAQAVNYKGEVVSKKGVVVLIR